MKIRNFDLVKEMKMRTKSISALLLAVTTMAPAAVIGATSYNDTVKTNFSHPISNVPGKSLVAVEVSYPPGGADSAYYATRLRGASNEKARHELNFRPRPLEWLQAREAPA